MTGFKDMCQAGMALGMMTETFKENGIQTDITLAIRNSIEVMGEDE